MEAFSSLSKSVSSLSSLSGGLNVNVSTLNDARRSLVGKVSGAARSIASELSETAKELRDAHTEFGGEASAVGVGASAVGERETRETRETGETGETGDGSREGCVSDLGRSVDGPEGVSDRLAALKEKLQKSRERVGGGEGGEGEAVAVAVQPRVSGKDGSVDDNCDNDARSASLSQRVVSLEEKLEAEVRKNAHLLGLYEDAEEEAREALARRDEAVRLLEVERARERLGGDGDGEGDEDRGSRSAAESEIRSLTDQLEKLKMQMLATQTAFEEQIEAEVQERVAAIRTEVVATSGDDERRGGDADGDADDLMADLEIALDKIAEAEKEAAFWKGEAERQRVEMSNMQIALDELRYESEAGEKLRVEVRSMQAEVAAMEARLADAEAAGEAARRQAEESVRKAEEDRRKLVLAREAEGVAKRDVVRLHSELAERAKAVEGGAGDGGGALRRDVVVEVFKEMTGMRHGRAMKHGVERLGLTEAERRAVLGDGTGLASTFVSFLESAVVDDDDGGGD